MRRKGITILTILILLAVPVTLCAWGFLLPACFSETFMGELTEKVRRLDLTEGRRIVVVGGSAAAFGVDSDFIEGELGEYNVVNFGMYAGLGTCAMLDLSEKSIREGDIVIVMPEQQEQSLSDYFGAKYFWQAADGNFGLLTRLSRDNLMQAAGEFPVFAADKFRYNMSGTMPEPDAVYRKSSFAENGDIREGLAVINRLPGGFDVNTPILFAPGMMNSEFADRLNEYAVSASKRGAAVLFHFSPMNEKAVKYEDPANASAELFSYTSGISGKLVCPVLGDPRDSIMDSEYFFDTNFHLTDEGRRVFSRQLVRDLKAWLGDCSMTEAGGETSPASDNAAASASDNAAGTISEASEIASIPQDDGTASISSETESGSGNDSDGFAYELRDGVCVLTRLFIDAGTHDITVPSQIDGHVVEVIAADAFAGRDEITSVTVPAGVRLIEDYAFDGCSSLKTIYMESAEPEACVVGQHLLDGTNADILVPAEALSAYRLNYNWSVWAERIRGID